MQFAQTGSPAEARRFTHHAQVNRLQCVRPVDVCPPRPGSGIWTAETSRIPERLPGASQELLIDQHRIGDKSSFFNSRDVLQAGFDSHDNTGRGAPCLSWRAITTRGRHSREASQVSDWSTNPGLLAGNSPPTRACGGVVVPAV